MAENKRPTEFHFLADPDDGLKCLICFEVAKEPLQHEACGKLFCKECLEKYGRQKPCPNCREQDSHFYMDNRSKRVIQDLGVRCPNAKRNCTWEGTVSTLEEHVATCQFSLLSCPNSACPDQFLRKDLHAHLESCDYRDYECICGEKGTYRFITRMHSSACQSQSAMLPCKYERIGCDVKLKREDLVAHEQNDKLHLHMAIDKTMQLQDRIVKVEEDAAKRIVKLKEDAAKRIVKLEEDAAKRIVKLEEDAATNMASMWSKIKALETSTKAFVDSLEYKHEFLCNVIDLYMPLEFTITRYCEKRQNNRIYTSQPFYSRKFGEAYNLAIRIDTDGNEEVRGEFISAYVLVKEGRYDNQISWPFLGKVTITLLNQLEDKNHHSCRTVVMEAAQNMHPGGAWGFDKYIPQSELGYDPVKNTQYLMNDRLYFRVYILL